MRSVRTTDRCHLSRSPLSVASARPARPSPDRFTVRREIVSTGRSPMPSVERHPIAQTPNRSMARNRTDFQSNWLDCSICFEWPLVTLGRQSSRFWSCSLGRVLRFGPGAIHNRLRYLKCSVLQRLAEITGDPIPCARIRDSKENAGPGSCLPATLGREDCFMLFQGPCMHLAGSASGVCHVAA